MRWGKIFFLDSEFLPLLRNFRILWLAGRFGGGKTALATILAAHLVWAGDCDDIVANFPCAVANPNPTPPLRRTALILDEAWQFARDSKAVEKYAAFLRKSGNFILLPSVFPVHPRLSTLWVERVFSAYVVGLPLWVFRWNLTRLSYREKGLFAVVNPHLVFAHFDSWAVTQDDGKIADLLAQSFPQPPKSSAKTPAPPPPPARPAPQQLALPLADTADVATEITDSLSALESTLQSFTEQLEKLRRRRLR